MSVARAMGATAIVHGALLALGGAFDVGLTSTLAAATGRAQVDLGRISELVPALREAGEEVVLGGFLGALLMLALATPLLVFWAEAMRLGPRAGAERALPRTPSVLLVSVALAVPAALSLAAVVLAASGAYGLMAGPDARAQDLSALVAGLVGALPLLVVATWHDVARVAVAAGARPIPALRRAAPAALRLAPLYALVLVLRGLFAAALLAGPVLQQLGLAARTAVRGAWLAFLVARS